MGSACGVRRILDSDPTLYIQPFPKRKRHRKREQARSGKQVEDELLDITKEAAEVQTPSQESSAESLPQEPLQPPQPEEVSAKEVPSSESSAVNIVQTVDASRQRRRKQRSIKENKGRRRYLARAAAAKMGEHHQENGGPLLDPEDLYAE